MSVTHLGYMNDGFVFLTALTTHMILRNAPVWPTITFTDRRRQRALAANPTLENPGG
jgi:hypothetical protein